MKPTENRINLQINKNNIEVMPFKEETSNDKFSTNDCNFEHRQDDLLKEIDRLKSELQSLVPLLDDEPERTLIRRSITHSKEIMSLLGEDNRYYIPFIIKINISWSFN